jgi:xanthine dehydrogenase YagR molybdenum-binding subunit
MRLPNDTATASRIDGPIKVTGHARYGSDFAGGANPLWAYLATSTIGRGRISHIDETGARAVNGVVEILTSKSIGNFVKSGQTFTVGGYMGSTIAPLASDKVWHAGQIVAVVVADTFEQAREAASRLAIVYEVEQPKATFDSREGVVHTDESRAETRDRAPGPRVGDAAGAYAAAPIKVDENYSTPAQHHNPMELFTTTCAWSGGRLTVWESSQSVCGFQHGLADQLGISPADIRIVSPYLGGAFGARSFLSQTTVLIAWAARLIGRPVKLEATRADCFTIGTYRAETRHRVRLAAGIDGKLKALIHDGWEISSRPDDYKAAGVETSTRIYDCPNVDSSVTIVHADRNTPGFMRAPAEVPYFFALESAMDELAIALRMDPVELRRVNDTMKEPIGGLPYTSRSLMRCFDVGAKEFGWGRRKPAPGSMRDGDWMIGWGCGASMYPTFMAPAAVRVTLTPDGSVRIQTATHEMGQGVRTALALTACAELGLPLTRVTVEAGDTDLPPAPVAGGSNSTASVCNVVAKACREIRDRIIGAAVGATDSAFHQADPASLVLIESTLRGLGNSSEPLTIAAARVGGGAIEVYAENTPHGTPSGGLAAMYKGQPAFSGGTFLKDRIQAAFGAQFVEVRVHAATCEVRIPRLVGVYAAGRIVNAKTAKSQLMGAQIWGIGSALHEATELDMRTGRYVNDDLAGYMIPVNADIGTIESILLSEEDSLVNDLGIKGIGELGNVGLNAAIANAVYHATGVRVRDLPIRIEKLMRA